MAPKFRWPMGRGRVFSTRRGVGVNGWEGVYSCFFIWKEVGWVWIRCVCVCRNGGILLGKRVL